MKTKGGERGEGIGGENTGSKGRSVGRRDVTSQVVTLLLYSLLVEMIHWL